MSTTSDDRSEIQQEGVRAGIRQDRIVAPHQIQEQAAGPAKRPRSQPLRAVPKTQLAEVTLARGGRETSWGTGLGSDGQRPVPLGRDRESHVENGSAPRLPGIRCAKATSGPT